MTLSEKTCEVCDPKLVETIIQRELCNEVVARGCERGEWKQRCEDDEEPRENASEDVEQQLVSNLVEFFLHPCACGCVNDHATVTHLVSAKLFLQKKEECLNLWHDQVLNRR